MVLLRKCVVEKEVVVPKVGERLVVASVSLADLYLYRFPSIFWSEAVCVPELCVIAECALELEPLCEGNLSADVCEDVVSLSLALVDLCGSDRVAYAAVPFCITLRTSPLSVLILYREYRKSIHCVSDAVASAALCVCAESYVC